ncbi:MAG: class IV adenylate cyclase, partial [Pseudonocardiaceae bacterium]
ARRGESCEADRVGIEAELKTRVHDIDRVRGLLRQRAAEQNSVYADSYFDTPDRTLTHDGCELRVREMHTDDDATVILLTYKGAPVHAASRSKPETETTADDADALRAILAALGFDLLIAFEKRCSNYHFTAAGQPLLATLVYVPELEETFLEIETIVDSETKVEPALGVMRQVLGELEIDRNDETIETYTEAVSARRSKP